MSKITPEKLTDVAVLTNMELSEDPKESADNLFVYLEPRLSSLSKTGNLSYARFDTNTLYRRRDPTTNKVLHNIDTPRFGLTPTLNYRMIGSRSHLDASLAHGERSYQLGTTGKAWSGMWWKPDRMEGIQVQFTTIWERSLAGIDSRFRDFFW